MSKDIKFVAFTDAIEVKTANYYSIKMKDGSVFIYTSVDTFQTIKDYGYDETDYESYTIRLYVTPLAKYISRVLYGGVSFPFSIVGKNLVDLVIPSSSVVEGYSLTNPGSYTVTSSAMVSNRKVDMDFYLNTDQLGSVEGLLKLSQQVIKVMLSKTRSNRFSLGEGTSLMGLLGENSTVIKVSETMTEVLEATENYILKKQSNAITNFFSLTPSLDDKLSSLTLISVNINEENPDRVEVIVQMRTLSVDAITIPMVV